MVVAGLLARRTLPMPEVVLGTVEERGGKGWRVEVASLREGAR